MIRNSRTLFTFHSTVTFLYSYSICKARMTAIIVPAIYFVNWSISTQTTCSRSESIRKPLATDRAIVYTYRSAIERTGISTSYGKCSKRSHFDGESLPTNHEFPGKYSHYRDFVRFTFTTSRNFSRATAALCHAYK